MNQGTLIDVPAYSGNEDDNQRFTLEPAKQWCLALNNLDRFTLDVAACPESHLAPVWYGQQDDGSFLDGLHTLSNPWHGDVFCNPPWNHIGPWVDLAWIEMSKRPDLLTVTMLLPGNRTHRPWWQELVEPFRDGGTSPTGIGGARLKSHFAPERFAYGHPGNPRGIGCGEPNFTSVALVWRRAA